VALPANPPSKGPRLYPPVSDLEPNLNNLKLKIKNKILRPLISCLLALSTAASLLRADRAADVRNEIVPPGHTMHSPSHRSPRPSDASSPAGNGYTPQQMWHAYGIDQLNTTGQGQTIAIIDAYGSSTIQTDLNTFCAAFNLPTTTVQVYYAQGTAGTDPNYPGWANETSLDVEWAHAIAPGAKIVLIVTQSSADADLYAGVDYAVSLGATQVSMSWGDADYSTEGTSDYHFNVPGVTFFASSGDNGSYVNGVTGVSYPACSPYVVGVGGTSLYLDASGNYSSETAWSYSTFTGLGGGGGTSVYETIPSYQAGWWNGATRGVPDVAMDGDPATGVPIYLTRYGWSQWGGTSLSSPCWAGLSALVNSLRSQSLNSAPGALYSLAAANYAGCYHDIISGNNGAYSTGPGYDLVTGLGTPIANQLVPALAGSLSSQVFAPVFSPRSGVYSNAQNLAVALISGTAGASIRYTTDGSTPTETNGTLYTGPVSIGAATTLTAIAYKGGFTDSPVTSSNYTFLPQVATPAFSPPAGTYTVGQSVAITTATSGASIRYTTDGSTPTETIGTLYSGAVTINTSTVLNAIAYGSGFIDSPVTSSAYTINLPLAAAPVLSPAAGIYSGYQWVFFSEATNGATIVYTTDGSTPTETSGMAYSGPVLIGSTTALKAIAYEAGIYSGSPVTGGVYTITSSPGVVLNVMADFTGSNDAGGIPVGGLVQGSDGNFYGTTTAGGSGDGNGTVFKMTPAGVLTTLVSFDGVNGDTPLAGLVQGSDGSFYGTTSGYGGSGASSNGTVFKITPAGVLTTLFTFNGANGQIPYANLVQGGDGNLYGTTQFGGTDNDGTVFKITPAGILTTLVSFNGPNGIYPIAALVQGSDGNFYGTTVYGGSANGGTVFKITPAGILTSLASFNGTNGFDPGSNLVQGSDGNFYGTTEGQNGEGTGTVFKMTPAGVLTTLFAFNGTDGSLPLALVRGRDGNFYGTTSVGGSTYVDTNNQGDGTVFKMTPAGVLTTLVSFDGANGSSSQGALVQGSDGNFYDTATAGGTDGFGVIFKLIIPPQVAAPTFSPAAGIYTSAQKVTISTTTSGASIRYTTDGSMPTETNGTLYSGPVSIGTVGTATTLNAIAYETGDTDSAVTGGTYSIDTTVSSSTGFSNLPMSSSQAGIFTATFDASPSLSPSNATIALCKGTQTAYTGLSCIARFNTSGDIDAYNGSSGYQAASVIPYAKGLTYYFRMVVNVPANTYSVYVTPPGGSEVLVGSNYAFRKAASSLDTWNIDVNSTPGGSVTVSNLSVIGTPQVAAPSFSPGAGTYSTAQTVIITDSTSGASIRYTTDGVTTPSETNGTVYSGSISISATTTLKAIAYKSGFTDSTVTPGLFTINTLPPQVAAPAFSPAAGTYTSAQTVTISTATNGASIRYTTDGVTTPTETVGTIYSGSVLISTTTKLEAIAYKAGMTDSSVTSGQYTISSTTRSLTGTSGNGFHALALTSSQTGTFTATFDATPSVSPENAVVGLSKGVATAYSGLSCIARFNPTGDIDAYNKTAYAAASLIPYSAGVTYHFRLVVNVTANTYSVYVTPSGGSELTVGLNYGFRTAQTSLNTWDLDVDATPASCSLTANNLNP
jgi:uncharacterized repeat protein (TIGR03803 family)